MDWKKEAERIREAMLETDPEYRKRSEETRKRFREAFPMLRDGEGEE